MRTGEGERKSLFFFIVLGKEEVIFFFPKMHGLTTFSLKQGETLAAVKNFMQYTKVRHRQNLLTCQIKCQQTR